MPVSFHKDIKHIVIYMQIHFDRKFHEWTDCLMSKPSLDMSLDFWTRTRNNRFVSLEFSFHMTSQLTYVHCTLLNSPKFYRFNSLLFSLYVLVFVFISSFYLMRWDQFGPMSLMWKENRTQKRQKLKKKKTCLTENEIVIETIDCVLDYKNKNTFGRMSKHKNKARLKFFKKKDSFTIKHTRIQRLNICVK